MDQPEHDEKEQPEPKGRQERPFSSELGSGSVANFLRGADGGAAVEAGDPAAIREATRAVHERLSHDLEELRESLEHATTEEQRAAVVADIALLEGQRVELDRHMAELERLVAPPGGPGPETGR